MLHVPFLQLVQILTHPDDAWDVEKTDSTILGVCLDSVKIVVPVDIVPIMVKITILLHANLAAVVRMPQADQLHAPIVVLVSFQVQLLHRVQLVILANILVHKPRRVHIVILVNILVQQPRRVQIVILVNILVRGLRLQTLLPDRI